MPGPGLTQILGRLLSDDVLRSRWVSAPQDFAAELELDESTMAALSQLDILALEAQAHSLLLKRYGEVRRILPQTFAQLGADGRALFMRHARAFWPQGHRRHLLDAQEFLRWLDRNGIEHERLESARLDFALSPRRFSSACIRSSIRYRLPRLLLQIDAGRGRRYELLI